MLDQVQAMVPSDTDVIFVGDGEFDGQQLQAAITAAGWHYACRTAHNRWLCEADTWFQLNELWLQPGDQIILSEVLFTQQAYGPVLVWPTGSRATRTPLSGQQFCLRLGSYLLVSPPVSD
ncbi:MAG: hypothetical protein H6633_08545 [Anaerolineales bacterium]|nr:hypothetical protein [Anaerolineales bacterium]